MSRIEIEENLHIALHEERELVDEWMDELESRDEMLDLDARIEAEDACR